MTQQLRIFVSHSGADSHFGVPLVQDLSQALVDEASLWYDSAGGLSGGDLWWDKIVRELTQASLLLLILSPDAMNSEWVRREFFLAFSRRLRIIPLLYRQCNIWPDAKMHQCVSFLPPKPYAEALNDLLSAIRLPSVPFQGDFTASPAGHLLGSASSSAEALRLKRKQSQLSNQLTRLNDKLEYFYKSLASRAPGASAYELQKDVEITEAECSTVEQQLTEIEKKIQ